MRIFLAGGISGNLNFLWKKVAKGDFEAVKCFLAGCNGRWDIIWEAMKVDLTDSGNCEESTKQERPYILESFFYCDENTEKLLPYFGDFLLDSGAFTFMQGTSGAVDWDGYIERYAEFIRRNNISKFFELDIDSVVGYDRVKPMRRKLENLANRQSIPVWHKSRGIEEYRKLCDEYPYVALGGIVSGEFTKADYRLFPALIAEAHKRGAKVHGLGFTNLSLLPSCHFDSVDSTAWTTGNRFGFIYKFDGKTMRKIEAGNNRRLGDPRKVALNNFTEWIKYQRYAEIHF